MLCKKRAYTGTITIYLDHAFGQLGTTGNPVLDADVARRRRTPTPTSRLSPYMRRHINFRGHYSFSSTDLAGERRAPRDPDAPDED